MSGQAATSEPTPEMLDAGAFALAARFGEEPDAVADARAVLTAALAAVQTETVPRLTFEAAHELLERYDRAVRALEASFHRQDSQPRKVAHAREVNQARDAILHAMTGETL